MSSRHQVQEGDQKSGGTWNRPSTPMYEKVGEEWVSKGWNELEHKGWLFKAFQRPEMSAKDKAQLSQNMGIDLPTAVFPSNLVTAISHKTGVSVIFSSEDSLRDWSAEAKRIGSQGWTHANPYTGSLTTDRETFRKMLMESKRIEATEFVRPVATRMRIPLDLLQKKSHIFFYDSITLASEESLKGQSEVSVKIRVMEDFFLILLRCFIVTPQGVSMRDTRWFHRFGDKFLLQDVEVREASLRDLENAVARLRPVSASVNNQAVHDQRYFSNPEQVWEALEPKLASNWLIAIVI